MYLLPRIAAVLVGASLVVLSNAHSTSRNALTYLSRVENAVINTPSHRLHATSEFDIEFDLHGGEQRIRLTLEPNHAVLPQGATVSYLGEDKEPELINRADYLIYKGSSWVKGQDGKGWTNAGWARIVMHQDGKKPLFEGAFQLNGNHHHVQTRAHFTQTRHELDPELEKTDEEFLVVWRDSDIGSAMTVDDEGNMHEELRRRTGVSPSCSADSLSFNTQPDHPVFRAMRRDDSFWGAMSSKNILGRQTDGQTFGNSAGINLLENIGSAAGCPTTRKVALIGMATDCTYTASFADDESLRKNVYSIINTATVVYEDTFNITLGLQNLIISKKDCPATAAPASPWNVDCQAGIEIQDRLNLFSAWRGQQADTFAFWTLLNNCKSGSAVGLAWLGQACVQQSQVAQSATGANETVSGANVVVRTAQEWQVVAHEVGHTFGAVHDCSETSCASLNTVNSQQCCPFSRSRCDADGGFIMNPSTGEGIKAFSPCSIGNICTAIGRTSVKTGCLVPNFNITTIQGQQCGNGIVESGEDCDCGGVSGCAGNRCCDPTTCKFKQAAVCDPGNADCCNEQCQFSSSGTVCRASTGTCDPQETCSGTTASCPLDTNAPDGQSCGDSLTCASGQCTSRNLQCQSLMGSFAKDNTTYACTDQDCLVSCQSPSFNGKCYSMMQNFLDGTSCQGGGKCSNGRCAGASLGKEITSWIERNKTLVIALSCGIGGLLLISIIGCCFRGYKRRQRQSKLAAMPPRLPPNRPPPGWQQAQGRHQNYGGNGQAYMSPAMAQQPSRNAPVGGGGWGNDGRWNPNAGYGSQPPAPTWQPSVRYA